MFFREGFGEKEVTEIICNIMYFYQGGIEYTTLMKLPIPKLIELQKNAEKINNSMKKEMDRANKKSESQSKMSRRR